MIEDHETLERASGGVVTRQTGIEIRELVGEVRRLQQEKVPRVRPTASELVVEACGRMAGVMDALRRQARLRGDVALSTRLDQLRREHPLRARAATVIACSLEAYAAAIREFRREVAGTVEATEPQQLEGTACEIRERCGRQHQRRAELADRTARRDRVLVAIRHRLEDVCWARAASR